METRSNFEDKLQEMFDDFSTPLRDSQWDRMEAALLDKKKSRRRWWLIPFIVLLAGGACFTAGYWVSSKSKIQMPPQTTVVKETIPSINNSKKAKENNIESEKIAKSLTTNSNEMINSTTDEPIQNSKTIKPSNKVNKGAARSLDNGITDNNDKVPEAKKLLRNPIDLGNLIPPKTEKPFGNNPTFVNFKFNKRHVSQLSLSNLAWEKPVTGPFLKATKPSDTEHRKIRKYLLMAASSLSLEIEAGVFNRKSGLNTYGLTSPVPNLKQNLEDQMAEGKGTRFGINLRSQVYKGLSVSAGAIYHQSRERAQLEYIHNFVPFYDSSMTNILGFIEYDDSVAPRSNITINNKITYLQIPLRLRYDVRFAKKWKAGISAGYAFNVPLNMKVAYFDVINFKYQNISKDVLKLAGNKYAGVHIDYQLTKGIWLGANYQYSQARNSFRWFNQPLSIKEVQNRFNLSMTFKL